MSKRSPHAERGLSLMEVCIGMVIIGVLMAGAMATYRTYQHTRAAERTAANLAATEEALGTFVSRFGRYPVPMAFRVDDGDAHYGREGTLAGICSAAPPGDARICRGAGAGGNVLIGSLPFMDLNIPYDMTLDGMGRRFTYAVSEEMTLPGGNDPALRRVCVKKQDIDAAGNIVIRDCTVADNNPPQDIAIVAHGRDGKGAWTGDGRAYADCTSGTAQAQNENCDNDGEFMWATARIQGDTAEFNDDSLSVDIMGDPNAWQNLAEGLIGRNQQFVGIGVATPTEALDVNGVIKADQVRTPLLCRNDGADETDCFDPDKIAGSGMRCGPTGYVSGIAHSDVLCESMMAAFNCPAGQILNGIDASGGPNCIDPALATPTCAPTFQTQSVGCPVGYTGDIDQRRDYECPAAAWTAWYETANNCVATAPSGCTDECGAARTHGERWCTAGTMTLGERTSECDNGNITHPSTISGIGCDSGGTLSCP